MKRFYNYGKASVTINPTEAASVETLFDEIKEVIASASSPYEAEYVIVTWDKAKPLTNTTATVRFSAKEMLSAETRSLHPDTE